MASIDGPGSDVALEDGFLLDTAHLGDGLPVVSIHFGVDLDTLDWRVVNATQVGGAQQRKPVCVCVCVCACVEKGKSTRHCLLSVMEIHQTGSYNKLSS